MFRSVLVHRSAQVLRLCGEEPRCGGRGFVEVGGGGADVMETPVEVLSQLGHLARYVGSTCNVNGNVIHFGDIENTRHASRHIQIGYGSAVMLTITNVRLSNIDVYK